MTSNPFEQIRDQMSSDSSDLEKLKLRMRSHNKFQLTGLLAILVGIAVIGFGYADKHRGNNDEVLGTDQVAMAELSSKNIEELCQWQGGIVMKNDLGDYCYLTDGRKCKLDHSFADGNCTEEEVLGVTKYESPSPTPPPTPIPVSNLASLYKVQITRKPGTIDPVELELKKYLHEALELKTDSERKILDIYFDTNQGSPYEDDKKYYFEYMLAISGPELDTPAVHEDYATIIRVTKLNDDLLDNLANNKSCNTNADCVIRRSYCSYGAYNSYDAFVDGYSCVQILDNFGDSRIYFDKEKQCKAEKVYDEAICENNVCRPSKQAARCVE